MFSFIKNKLGIRDKHLELISEIQNQMRSHNKAKDIDVDLEDEPSQLVRKAILEKTKDDMSSLTHVLDNYILEKFNDSELNKNELQKFHDMVFPVQAKGFVGTIKSKNNVRLELPTTVWLEQVYYKDYFADKLPDFDKKQLFFKKSRLSKKMQLLYAKSLKKKIIRFFEILDPAGADYLSKQFQIKSFNKFMMENSIDSMINLINLYHYLQEFAETNYDHSIVLLDNDPNSTEDNSMDKNVAKSVYDFFKVCDRNKGILIKVES